MDKQTEQEFIKQLKDAGSNPSAIDIILRQAGKEPATIDKKGCELLARAGKAVWNAWREAYPVRTINPQSHENNANFDSCNFISDPIDFSGFVLGNEANFKKAQFGDRAQFTGAQFGKRAQFDGAQFGDLANFEGAQFGNGANFNVAQFGDLADFAGAQFGDGADFQYAQFGYRANFEGAQFGCNARLLFLKFGAFANFKDAMFDDFTSFAYSVFHNHTTFKNTQFGGSVCFVCAKFGKWTVFQGTQFGWEALFDGVKIDEGADFSGTDWAMAFYGNQTDKRKTWAEQRGLAPNRFKRISFQGATFQGRVNFSNREFTDTADFSALKKDVSPDDKVVILPAGTPTTFAVAPLFHNATLHPDTSFDGVQFLDVGEPDRDRASIESAAHAYRTLKLAFSGQQATRQEQQFLRLEMAEEALLAPSVREWLRGQREHDLPPRFYYTIYRLLSDYGFSIWRPVVLLLASLSVLFLPWLALGWGAWFLWCVMGTPTKKERGKSSLLVAWLVAIFAALLVGIVIALLGSPVLWLGLWQAVSHCDLSDYINVAIPALFPSPFSSHGFDWGCVEETSAALQTVQKVLAVLAWFLIGLALRNRFKMK